MKNTILIFALLFIVLSLTGLSCSKKDNATPTPTPTTTEESDLPVSNYTNIDAAAIATIDDTITTNFNQAKEKAKEWKEDAVLVNMTVKLSKNLALSQATQTFVFGSATEGRNWWSFSLSEASGKYIRAAIPKEDYLGADVKPINMNYWKMNYIKAFQLAEANGGKAFRLNNKNSEVIATLSHSEPKGWLWWQIEYKSLTTGNKMTIKVNPFDSNVVDEQGNPLGATAISQ